MQKQKQDKAFILIYINMLLNNYKKVKKYKKSIKNIWQTYNNSVKYDCYEKKERELVSTRLQKVMGIKAKDY